MPPHERQIFPFLCESQEPAIEKVGGRVHSAHGSTTGFTVQQLYLKNGTINKSRLRSIVLIVSVNSRSNCGRRLAVDTAETSYFSCYDHMPPTSF